MDIVEALTALGSTNVVWVDDKFNRTLKDLADLLIRDPVVSAKCGFEELDRIFVKANVDEAGARFDLEELLGGMEQARVEEIRRVFFEKEASEQQFSTKELSDKAIERICQVLQVKPEGRWTFDHAAEEIGKVEDGNDVGRTYIVDLNEAGGSRTRGLDILQQLQARKSKGNAFILTHDATKATEGESETELRKTLRDQTGDPITIPICVIAKERLFDYENEEALNKGLVAGVKRAAIRRSLFDVIDRVRGTIHSAFERAADQLSGVLPEQLEAFVFECAYKEGVSELHVVERIVTGQIAHDVRHFFGTDEAALASAFRLRELRDIPLSTAGMTPDENLTRFRTAEIWESDELINRSYSPIACGDVFEFDPQEKATASIPRRFVLLGQPCDIALRPDGKRAQEAAFLVQLKKMQKSEGGVKVYPLPFRLSGEQWVCDFRNATVVRLPVLDLASFRADGRVRVDVDHVQPSRLLVSQQLIYEGRTAAATKILEAGQSIQGGGLLTDGLQLCVSQDSPFKQVFAPSFEDMQARKPANDPSDNKKRVTWRLRRSGRIRHPYVSALFAEYLDMMGRHAFDLDFIDVEISAAATPDQPPAREATGTAPEAIEMPAVGPIAENEGEGSA